MKGDVDSSQARPLNLLAEADFEFRALQGFAKTLKLELKLCVIYFSICAHMWANGLHAGWHSFPATCSWRLEQVGLRHTASRITRKHQADAWLQRDGHQLVWTLRSATGCDPLWALKPPPPPPDPGGRLKNLEAEIERSQKILLDNSKVSNWHGVSWFSSRGTCSVFFFCEEHKIFTGVTALFYSKEVL